MQGRLHVVGSGCRNPAKDAMRHFWKIVSRVFVFLPKLIQRESGGELFWRFIRAEPPGRARGFFRDSCAGGGHQCAPPPGLLFSCAQYGDRIMPGDRCNLYRALNPKD